MDLNSEQTKAVNHEDGPLLIIAGAGTGKTKVITSRILRLIKSGKAKPQEILALTFTDKAANEMLGRVDSGMETGYYELCIKTFHSFSEQILRESGLEIGIDPQYKISDKFGQFVLFKKHLFDFELDYYRPLGNPTSFLDKLLTYFSRLKDELIKPDDYLAYAKNIVESCIKREEEYEGELEDAEKTLEIAKAYKKYQETLMANGMLDFGDLNFYANELFDKRKSVLTKYQNLFKYILIDEFQDTNYAQFQLILKLAGKHKNICVVGDDDQSIYKWRGASLSNILQFEDFFPDAKKVILTKNFRSTQNILDASYSLIQNNNPDRLEVKANINKKLTGAKDGNLPVELNHFPDFLQESSFVAEKIKELHEKNGINFKDIAILVRSNRLAYPFIEDLKFLQIPYQVKNPKGLFALEEIKDLIAVLKFISNPYDNVAILRILRLEIFDVKNLEILNLLNKAKNDSIFSLLNDDSKVCVLLKDLIEFSKNRSAGASINEFLQKSKLLNYLIEKGKYEELDNINEFAKQVAKFEKENKEKSAGDFINYLNLLEEAEMPLGETSAADLDSVQILTAHGAKGLEFECVFVVNAVNERFPARKHGGAFEIPENLTKEIYPEGDFRIQEERRLFYVAMTRAKKYLFITYSDQYEGNKKWRISPFVKEVLESGKVKIVEHKSSDNALKRLKEFKEPVKPLFDLPKFNDRRLSYSQFDTFKTCPLKYNYRHLMNIPVAPFHAANFGTSVHSTLNEFYKILKGGGQVNLDTMVRLYEKNWISYGYDSKEHEETRKEQGLQMLKNFYEANSKPMFVIPDALEQPFNLKVGEFFIIGRIDRIDKLSDGTFEVIDYKTGRLKDSTDITKDFQLSLYALACRDILEIKVSKLSLYYLEDGQKISTSRKDSDLNALPQKISEKIQNISSSDFTPTPGIHCKFCDFRLICPASYF